MTDRRALRRGNNHCATYQTRPTDAAMRRLTSCNDCASRAECDAMPWQPGRPIAMPMGETNRLSRTGYAPSVRPMVSQPTARGFGGDASVDGMPATRKGAE